MEKKKSASERLAQHALQIKKSSVVLDQVKGSELSDADSG